MVTFETKVYENDWEYILKGNYLEKLIQGCNYPFEKKTLLINNVTDVFKVQKLAEKKVASGLLDSYYVVSDYAKDALNYFNIEENSFKGGFYYSISELVGIYLAKTAYLLHLSGDSLMQIKTIDWIENAIAIFKNRTEIIVANPTWNFRYDQAKKESVGEIKGFYLGYGFSDQCYLIKTEFFKKRIYNERNDDSDRYPKYGGDLFEKRVDSYMRNHHFLRLTCKDFSYLNLNFPNNRIHKFLNRLSFGYLALKRFKELERINR